MTKSILLNGILLLSTTSITFGMETDKPLALILGKFSETNGQYNPIDNDGTITANDPIYVNEDFTKADLGTNYKITINKQYTASIIEKDGQYFVRKRDLNSKDIKSALTTITKEQVNSLFTPTHLSKQNDQQKRPFAIALAGNDLYHIKRKLKNEIIAPTTESPTLKNDDTKEKIQPPLETNNNNDVIEETTTSSLAQATQDKQITENKNEKINSAPSNAKIYIRNSETKKLYLIKKDGQLEESEATFDDSTCTNYNAAIEKHKNDQLFLRIWDQAQTELLSVYPSKEQINVINKTFAKSGSIFKIGKNGHSRLYQSKQPEDTSTTDVQKSMDFFVQYNSPINNLIYLITPEGDLVATK